jgi:hypothetical protein
VDRTPVRKTPCRVTTLDHHHRHNVPAPPPPRRENLYSTSLPDDLNGTTAPTTFHQPPQQSHNRATSAAAAVAAADAHLDLNSTGTTVTAHGATTTTTTTSMATTALLKKAALSRPFGRDDPQASILPFGAGWVVEVSEAEWDASLNTFKYRILVQRRTVTATPSTTNTNTTNLDATHPSSFTSAFTWRTVPDFQWLASALTTEFHGALLLPHLDTSGTSSSQEQHHARGQQQQQQPMDPSILKHWLADVLNGVRGSGEWILPVVQQASSNTTLAAPSTIDIIKSDSMETFLYRNSKGRSLQEIVGPPADAPLSPSRRNRHALPERNKQPALATTSTARPDRTHGEAAGSRDRVYGSSTQCQETSFFTSLWAAVAAAPLELCVGPQFVNATRTCSSSTSPRSHDDPSQTMDHQPDIVAGSSADFQVNEQYMDGTSSVVSGMSVSSTMGSPRGSSTLAIHSELLFAEKDLALHYQRVAENARTKLKVLYETEDKVSGAWKRFAVTLANLFSYEKDAESANLGDSKVKRENMPFRKVDKDTIDECLRILARQKTERAMPGLSILSAMLAAYAEDLLSVEPSVDIYAKAIRQLAAGPLPVPAEESSNSNSGGITASSVSTSSSSNLPQTSSGSSWDDLKEWTMKSLHKAKAGGDGGNRMGDDQRNHAKELAWSMHQEELKRRLIINERLLRHSLTTMLRTAPFRLSRIAWRYWNTEATQCAQLNSAAAELRCKLDIVSQSSVSKLLKRHSKDEKSDCAVEMELIQRIVNLGQGKKFSSGAESVTDGSVSTTSINNELVEVDNDDLNEGRSKAMKRDKALDIARHRIGRWNAGLAMSMMEAVGVDDPNVHVEETTRDLRMVRKYAIGLRECLNRCIESVHILREAITGTARPTTDKNHQSMSLPFSKPNDSAPNRLFALRNDFLADMSLMFSGTFVDPDKKMLPKRAVASRTILTNAGVDTSDPFGWLSSATTVSMSRTLSSSSKKSSSPASAQAARGVGARAVQYVMARDAQVEWLLSSLDGLLNEYYQRIEVVEGFVYMECVGIQLEKHFSSKRAKALSAFEKKTDLTTAMNMARKKRMTQLLAELQSKLEKLGAEVSHTSVKETKEAHLESKNLKAALHELAMRRLMRARETSTERVIAILSLWAKEEEINATEEIRALGEAMSVLERSVCQDESLEKKSRH